MIGKGAMGAVYRARQIRLDRVVAVKVMREDLLTNGRAVKRFENEAKTVGRFNSPYVVMIHDVGSERDLHYLVMEFVSGVNLRQRAQQVGGRIEFEEATVLLRQACEALKEAQRVGVLHRDIKPDNLMLGERGEIKVADFGIAKPLYEDLSLTMTAELTGTPLYMSPEQCRANRDLDYRSDMYSLGATFYYLLTGEPPAKAGSVYELIETKTRIDCLSLSKVLPDMPEDHPLSRIIEKMTALDRADRYGSYDEVIEDIDRVTAGLRPLAERPVARAAAAPPARGRGRLVAVGGLVVAVALAVAFWPRREPVRVTPPAGGGTDSPTLPVFDLTAALAEARASMRRDGPSQDLRSRVAAFPAGGIDATDARDRLLAALDAGIGARRELAAAASTRSTPQPPFDDLAAYLSAVDNAAKAELHDPDLQAWVAAERARVRNVDGLQAEAVAQLLSKWATWQTDRSKVQIDAAQVTDLLARLDAIERAGARLAELLGVDAARLRLPTRDWRDARANLRVPQVDFRQVLAAARERFRSGGPTASLRDEVAKIESIDGEVTTARDALRDAIDLAERAGKSIELVRLNGRPLNPQLPFGDIDTYYRRVDDALREITAANDVDARALGDRWRAAARDEAVLAPAAIAVLASAWSAVATEHAAAAGDAARTGAVAARIELLQQGRDRLSALYPDRAEAIAAAMPAGELTRLQQGIAGAVALDNELTTIGTLRRRLVDSRTLLPWLAERVAVATDLAAVGARVAGLGPAGAAAGTELAALQAQVEQRNAGVAALTGAVEALAAGRLAVAAVLAPAADVWREDHDLLAGAADACRQAFDGLQAGLELDAIAASLQRARAALGQRPSLTGPALARVDGWLARLAELRTAAAGMAVVAGGQTRIDGQPVPVRAFFLSCTEVTRAEWRPFVEAVASSWQAEAAQPVEQRLARLTEQFGVRLPGALTVEDLLRDRSALAQDPPARTRQPVDRVSQYAAAMFAAWRRRALPTLPEWTLAALGPIGAAHDYPWGDKWTDDRALRNIGRELQPADEGGPSWRSTERLVVRHLGGNAAEWLEAPDGATDGALAGGRCGDPLRDQREEAAGRPHAAHRGDVTVGFGLRTILRPRAFFGPDWPQW